MVAPDEQGRRMAGVGAPGVPVGAHGDGGQHGGVQAVAHSVDHGQVQDVVVEGVVQAVPGDVLGGFEDPGDGDLRRRHGERWQQ